MWLRRFEPSPPHQPSLASARDEGLSAPLKKVGGAVGLAASGASRRAAGEWSVRGNVGARQKVGGEGSPPVFLCRRACERRRRRFAPQVHGSELSRRAEHCQASTSEWLEASEESDSGSRACPPS